MPRISPTLTFLVALAATIVPAVADPNDWVNVDYVVNQPKSSSRESTLRAQNTIIGGAGTTAKSGPWSIVNSKGYLPPSGDSHDYMSWAPYHWPNCNWCGSKDNGKGRQHAVTNGTDSDPADDGYDGDEPSVDLDHNPSDEEEQPDTDDPFPDGGLWDAVGLVRDATNLQANKHSLNTRFHGRRYKSLPSRQELALSDEAPSLETPSAPVLPLLVGSPLDDAPSYESVPNQEEALASTAENKPAATATSEIEIDPAVEVPEVPIGNPPLTDAIVSTTSEAPSSTSWTFASSPTSTTDNVYSATPVQHAAKTTKCTPSPTKSMAPSSTWTTCPYVGRDGQANPDVRSLPGPGAINQFSQSLIYNAVAYALNQKQVYAQNIIKFTNAFFLDSATRMNPNLKFGQMVRGPGPKGVQGTYTGMLDMRGMVRVVNSIMVLKAVGSPDWTTKMNDDLSKWMTQYAVWLESDGLPKKARNSANNHGTFAAAQLCAVKYFNGDKSGAAAVLQNYFTHQFLDQVAQSGEQPFEAVRTRPFHYRCFNLEAMIMNAKLGDQLGLNLWTAKSKYGATIQTAIDFTMNLNPKSEDRQLLVPHVAAAAAAYGDPDGKYAAYMKKQMDNYQTKPFFFYSQTNALNNSPAYQRGQKRRALRWARDTTDDFQSGNKTESVTVPFECPELLKNGARTELEDGLFVSCDDVRNFY